jgi:hypothetical protein
LKTSKIIHQTSWELTGDSTITGYSTNENYFKPQTVTEINSMNSEIDGPKSGARVDKRGRLQVHIFDINFYGLFDGGASISLCRTNIWYQMGQPTLEEGGIMARAANGHCIPVKGRFSCMATIMGITKQVTFFVADNIQSEMIIGVDIMAIFDLWRDPIRNVVMTRQKIQQLNCKKESNVSSVSSKKQFSTNECGICSSDVENNADVDESKHEQDENWNLCLVKNITLPPRSARKINVKFRENGKFPPKGNVLGHFDIGHEELMCDSIMTYLNNGIGTLYVINRGLVRVKLEKGTKIGTFTEIVEESLASLSLSNEEEDVTSIGTGTGTGTGSITSRKITKEEEEYIRKHADLSHLPEQFRDKMLKLLLKNFEIISFHEFDLGNCTTVEHQLFFKHGMQIWTPQFPIPLEQFEEIKRQVIRWFHVGVIEKSNSEYNSPIFLVQKKGLTPDGKKKWRVVVDFRRINSDTYPETYRLPLISECLHEIARQQPTWFSCLDLRAGYNNIHMAKNSRDATSFYIPGCGEGTGAYRFKRAPFGLMNLPFVFQKLVQKVFEGLPVITYLDDILAMSKNLDDEDNPEAGMLQILQKCFDRLAKHKLKINLEKTEWAKKTVNFLGHEITGSSYRIAKDKMEAIKSATPPEDVGQVRQWNGLMNFFRQSIPNYAHLSKPLTRLTRKDCSWKRGKPLPEDAKKAFQELKEHMLSRPVLAYPVIGLPYELYVDGSLGDHNNPDEGGIGAILVQEVKGVKKVVSCFSRGLVKHEKAYNTFLVEQLAITDAIQHFRVYLLGREFTVYTDHNPLVTLATKTQERTFLRLQQLQQEYQFQTKYVKGALNPSDWLSRNRKKTEEKVTTMTIDFNPLLGISDARMNLCQREDPTIASLDKFLKTGEKPGNPSARRLFTIIKDDCRYQNGILKRWMNRENYVSVWVTILPAVFHADILNAVHSCEGFGGHEGQTKTLDRLLQHYWWPGVADDVIHHCESCEQCQRNDRSKDKKNTYMTPIPAPTGPMQRMHADLHGPIRASLEGPASVAAGATNKKKTVKNYILIMTDAYTKLTELVAIEDKSAETVAEGIWSRFLMRYGCPEKIITDQGKEFVAKITKSLFERLKIKKSQTTAFRPQADGQAEIVNKHIIKYLTTATSEGRCPDDWPERLPAMQFALNTSTPRSTKISPFFLMYGWNPRMPLLDQTTTERVQYGEDYATELCNRVTYARQIAEENNRKFRLGYKERFDKNVKPHDFDVGHIVMCHRQDRINNKYCEGWYGPYIILGIDDFGKVFFIQDMATKKTRYVNAAKLKRYNPREPTIFENGNFDDETRMKDSRTEVARPDASLQEKSDNNVNKNAIEEQFKAVDEKLHTSLSAPEITILNPWVTPQPKIWTKTEADVQTKEEPLNQTRRDSREQREEQELPGYDTLQEDLESPSTDQQIVRTDVQLHARPVTPNNIFEPRDNESFLQFQRRQKDFNSDESDEEEEEEEEEQEEEEEDPDYITYADQEMSWRDTTKAGSKSTKRDNSALSPPESNLITKFRKTVQRISPNKDAIKSLTRPVTDKLGRTRAANPDLIQTLETPAVPIERKTYKYKKQQ